MSEQKPDLNSNHLESSTDWIGTAWFDDGSRLVRSCYSDLETKRIIFEASVYRPDGSLTSRGWSFIDDQGNSVTNAEYRRPDGSLEFTSNIVVDSKTGAPVAEVKTYHKDKALVRKDRNYVNELGRLVLETTHFS